MARKNAPDYKPYRPLDEEFVRNTPTVFAGNAAPAVEESAKGPTLTVIPGQSGEERVATKQELAATKLNKYARYLTTDREFRDLQRFANDFSDAAGTTIELGKLIRACNTVMLHAQEELLEAVKAEGPLKRPRNDDPVGIVDFEHRLARIFSSAFRKSQTLK